MPIICEDLPDGVTASWGTWTGALINSISQFASKGITVEPQVNRYLTQVMFQRSGSASLGHAISLVVVELSEVNPGTIIDVIVPINVVSVIDPPDGQIYTLPVPVLMESGKIYGVIFVRTDGANNSALVISFPGGITPNPDPNGYFILSGAIRYLSNNPSLGQNVFFSPAETDTVDLVIYSEGVDEVCENTDPDPSNPDPVSVCGVPPVGRRRLFWSTQSESCGLRRSCGAECGEPGLGVEAGTEGATISTDNWLRGLMANMLMTDARLPDNPCGYRPGSQGGHWSESYIDNGPQVVGTLMRTVEPQARVQDVVNLLKQYAQITLQRLVARGAALAVDVDAFYEGSNIFRIDATITGVDNQQTNVSVSGARLSNSWVWEQ